MNVTRILSEFAVALSWDELPSAVRRRTRWCLADWVACAVAGIDWPTSRAVLRAWDSSAGQGPCTVAGQVTRYPAEAAVFLNAFMSEVLEIGHGHGDAGGHLGAPTIPVALALSEARLIDAREVLAAIVAGYEVFACIGGAVHPSLQHEGFISTGLTGAMGASVVAGRATGLSAEQTAAALGAAAYLAPASLIHEYYGTVNSSEAAQAASVGVLASRLAGAGLGGSDDPINSFCERFGGGNRLRRYLTRLGKDHQIMNLYFKPYPGCRFTHGPLEAVSAILAESAVRPEDIERIRVRVTPSSLHLCGKYTSPSSNFVEAQFSVPYVLATLVYNGAIGVESFTPDNLIRPELHDFARQRIKLESVWTDAGEVDLAAAEVELKTVSGTRWGKAILHPKGSPENPLNDSDLEQKFLMLTRTKFGDSMARWLLAHIHDVDAASRSSLPRLLNAISTAQDSAFTS